MELDNYKKHWMEKAGASAPMSDANKALVITHLNAQTKTKTSGLVGISLASAVMLGLVGKFQHSLENFSVDILVYISTPLLFGICMTSAWLYLKTTTLTPSEKNIKDYLTYINKKLKQSKAFMQYAFFPVLPVMLGPFMLSVMNSLNLSQHQIDVMILSFGVLVGLWWIIGFSFLFKKVIEKHEYGQLQKEVEQQLAAL